MRIPVRFQKVWAGREHAFVEREKSRDLSEAWKLPQPLFLLIRTPTTAGLILVVMVVVGAMLLGKVQALGSVRRGRTPHQVATAELQVLRTALELFRRDCGRYPSHEEGLPALVRNPGVSTWKGPYITLLRPDPWRTWYHYERVGEQVVLFSYGPDKQPRTADDIPAPVIAGEVSTSSAPRPRPPPAPRSTPGEHPPQW